MSKIVDRVCQQEGFEKVLAVDYRAAAAAPEDAPSPRPHNDKPAPASTGFSGRPASLGQARAGANVNVLASPATPTTASQSPASTQQRTPVSGLASPRRATGLLESVTSVFAFNRGPVSSPSPSPSPVQGQGGNPTEPLALADSVRRLDLDDDLEDEEDRRERERIHAEMIQLGFDPPPASRLAAASSRHTSTSPSIGTPAEVYSYEMSPGTRSGASSNTMILEEQEQHVLNELKAGRSSGFTIPPPRRMSMRQSLERSPQPIEGIASDAVIGLGIARNEASTSPSGYFGMASKSASPGPAVSPSEGAPAFRKALQRLSSAFTSPPVGS